MPLGLEVAEELPDAEGPFRQFFSCTHTVDEGTEVAAADGHNVSGVVCEPLSRLVPVLRYDRRLLRVFYLSSLSALKSCPASRTYYDRKRAEGKTHMQALLSLARRRLNVLWAMLRDGSSYTPTAPPAAHMAV